MNKRGYKNISEKGTPALSLLNVILEERIQVHKIKININYRL